MIYKYYIGIAFIASEGVEVPDEYKSLQFADILANRSDRGIWLNVTDNIVEEPTQEFVTELEAWDAYANNVKVKLFDKDKQLKHFLTPLGEDGIGNDKYGILDSWITDSDERNWLINALNSGDYSMYYLFKIFDAENNRDQARYIISDKITFNLADPRTVSFTAYDLMKWFQKQEIMIEARKPIFDIENWGKIIHASAPSGRLSYITMNVSVLEQIEANFPNLNNPHYEGKILINMLNTWYEATIARFDSEWIYRWRYDTNGQKIPGSEKKYWHANAYIFIYPETGAYTLAKDDALVNEFIRLIIYDPKELPIWNILLKIRDEVKANEWSHSWFSKLRVITEGNYGILNSNTEIPYNKTAKASEILTDIAKAAGAMFFIGYDDNNTNLYFVNRIIPDSSLFSIQDYNTEWIGSEYMQDYISNKDKSAIEKLDFGDFINFPSVYWYTRPAEVYPEPFVLEDSELIDIKEVYNIIYKQVRSKFRLSHADIKEKRIPFPFGIRLDGNYIGLCTKLRLAPQSNSNHWKQITTEIPISEIKEVDF